MQIKQSDCEMSTKNVINKGHFVTFLDNYTYKSIKPRKSRKQKMNLQLNEKKSKESQARFMLTTKTDLKLGPDNI